MAHYMDNTVDILCSISRELENDCEVFCSRVMVSENVHSPLIMHLTVTNLSQVFTPAPLPSHCDDNY